jgi:proteasome beta subunit
VEDLRSLFGVSPTGFGELLASRGLNPAWTVESVASGLAPEATTVLSLRYDGGVVMLGDRQATEGYSVAHREMQKVFEADKYSGVAISGTAGLALEMIRLFHTELEHYEKIEGTLLSVEGKATFLARMVRQQLPLAMQGLVVVPLFAGYDRRAETGRLYTFDVVGGRYEETYYGATGSGAREAKSFLRTSVTSSLTEDSALALSMDAVVFAAEQDVATAGPDVRRGIYPTMVVIDKDGYRDIEQGPIAAYAQASLERVI